MEYLPSSIHFLFLAKLSLKDISRWCRCCKSNYSNFCDKEFWQKLILIREEEIKEADLFSLINYYSECYDYDGRQLTDAIVEQDIEIVQDYLKKGVTITLEHFRKCNNRSIFELLLLDVAQINLSDLLEIVIKTKSEQFLTLLLAGKLIIGQRVVREWPIIFNRSAIRWAVACNNNFAVEQLLLAGHHPDLPSSDGLTPLYTAITYKSSTQIIEQLINAGADVDFVLNNIDLLTIYSNTTKQTFELLLSKADRATLKPILKIKKFLDIFFDIIKSFNRYNLDVTPLYSFILDSKSTDTIRSLIRFNPNAYYKNTPLFYHLSDYEYMFLNNDSFDINLTDLSTGKTILMFLIEKDSCYIESALSKQQLQINKQDNLGQTALLIAFKRRSNQIYRLIKAGADPNIKDKEGNSCLFLALINHGSVTAKRLIQAGADIQVTNKDGVSFVDFVKKFDGSLYHHLLKYK